MPLVKCRECGHEMSTSAAACPQCGARVAKPKLWLWVPLGLVGLFLLYATTRTQSPEEKMMWTRRDAIQLCWEDYKRKSLDPQAARFVAGVCEMKEQEFKDKYGRAP